MDDNGSDELAKAVAEDLNKRAGRAMGAAIRARDLYKVRKSVVQYWSKE